MILKQAVLYSVVVVAMGLVLANTNKAMAQTARYDRPTVSLFFANNGKAYDAEAYQVFRRIPTEDKFYYNNLGFDRIDLKDRSVEGVKRALYAADVPKKSLAYWFNRNAKGNMDIELLAKRAVFNAIDEDVLRSSATKRGKEGIKEYGYELLKETYFVVFDYGDISYKFARTKDGSPIHTWNTTVYAHVFRIDYTDSLQDQLFDAWQEVGDTSSPEERAAKNKLFDQIQVPVVHVKTVTDGITMSNYSINPLYALTRSMMSKEQLFAELISTGYANGLHYMENSVDNFSVKVGIYEVSPIRAKIGRKEGLRIDQRYDVVEYQQDDAGNVAPKRVGVLRASSKIADNRKAATGESELSQFYQIAGHKLEPGMTIKQRNDIGMGLVAGYQFSGQTGVKFRYEQMLNKIISTPWQALYAYVELEIDATSSERVQLPMGSEKPTGSEKSFTTTELRYGLGLGKGFQLMRYVSLLPNIGFMIENVTVDEHTVSTTSFRGGADLVFNLYYPVQGVVGAYAYGYGSPSITNADNQDVTAWSSGKYDKILLDRSTSGFSLSFGIKVNF